MVSKSLDHATDSVFWRSSAWKCSMALSNNDKTNLVYFRNSSTVFEFDKAIDIPLKRKGRFPVCKNYSPMNVLCRTKDMFADFSKSLK